MEPRMSAEVTPNTISNSSGLLGDAQVVLRLAGSTRRRIGFDKTSLYCVMSQPSIGRNGRFRRAIVGGRPVDRSARGRWHG